MITVLIKLLTFFVPLILFHCFLLFILFLFLIIFNFFFCSLFVFIFKMVIFIFNHQVPASDLAYHVLNCSALNAEEMRREGGIQVRLCMLGCLVVCMCVCMFVSFYGFLYGF